MTRVEWFQRRRPAILHTAALVLLASASVMHGCSGTTHPPNDDTEVVVVPATPQKLAEFRDALNHWSSIEASAPADVEALVAGLEVVLVGTLGPSGAGRSAPIAPDIFRSYANLEVRDVEVLKGALASPSEHVYVEVPWPINVDHSELMRSTPVGARVILIADHVTGAIEAARALPTNGGVDPTESVRANLVMVPPAGLLIEGVDGRTSAPLWEGGPLLASGADGAPPLWWTVL